MSRPSKKSRLILGFIFGIALIGLAFYAGIKFDSSESDNQNSSPPNQSTDPELVISESNQSNSSTSQKNELVILAESRGSKQIVAIDLNTLNRRVLFTDADETKRIQQVGNLTAGGKEVLVLLNQESDSFGGQLVSISLDGDGKKTVLIEQFASPWPPMFSPDAKKIAYIVFSNAEAGGGFSLVVANRDGTNKRELARESKPITQPIFSPTGDRIAYFIEQKSGTGNIMTVNLSGGGKKSIFEYTNRVPYDLTWSHTDQLAFIDGVGDQVDIFIFTLGKNEPQKLSTPALNESRPLFSLDGEKLVFASKGQTQTTIEQIDLKSGTIKSLGSGILPIGWISREAE